MARAEPTRSTARRAETRCGSRLQCHLSGEQHNEGDGMSSACQHRIAAKLLDNIREEQGVGKSGTVQVKGRGAHPKTITFSQTKVERRVTKEDLMRIKMRLDLSGNQTLHLRTAIRTVFGRRSVEEGAGDFQTELNHRLSRFFELVHLDVTKKQKIKKKIVETIE